LWFSEKSIVLTLLVQSIEQIVVLARAALFTCRRVRKKGKVNIST